MPLTFLLLFTASFTHLPLPSSSFLFFNFHSTRLVLDLLNPQFLAVLLLRQMPARARTSLSLSILHLLHLDFVEQAERDCNATTCQCTDTVGQNLATCLQCGYDNIPNLSFNTVSSYLSSEYSLFYAS
ncbi:hypothetical protein GYMLUDRAFT_613828 [Collybiopsis luxurians FD-317 M1]|uniref:Uncharacterized protein n=1 Tax=Collybiopsis luxurians FD-317 M1 TaxID=944289 RepID=A0A0D0CVT9_9AGAR|nr:hypothetical protein GYMLUDRAFT_613828 [Collybiopsis luxurians FD-317 M1]